MKFKLHSTDNKTWFHFREREDSLCNSFTVTYLNDGTVVLSGDYGTLTWRRNGFETARKGNYDYGFPSKESGLSYFAEKICTFGIEPKLKEFSYEKAWLELEEYYKDYEELTEEKINELKEEHNHEWGSEMSEEEFYKFLRDDLELIDYWELHLGVDYSEALKWRYEILSYVSDQIWNAVHKDVVANDTNNTSKENK